MESVIQFAPALGVTLMCAAFGVARATYYRKRAPVLGPKERRPSPPRRIPDEERETVLDVLHEPRFVARAGFCDAAG